MKITFVIQKLAGLKGGAERVLCEVTSALAARGLEVEIVTFERSGGAPGYGLEEVRVTNLFPYQSTAQSTAAPASPARSRYRLETFLKRIPNIPPLPRLKWALSYQRFIDRVTTHLQAAPPDVVVGFLPAGIIAAVQAGQDLRLPTIASTHNVLEQDFGEGTRWDANPIYRRARQQALADADRVLVLLPQFLDSLPEEIRHKAQVMANPVLQGPDPAPQAADRAPLILGVGRLVEIKRFDLLIAAWARLAPTHPDWRVEIYGEGPEEARLTQMIDRAGLQGRVTLAGLTDRITQVYQKAAILAHPAAFEGFGLSVAEALSHGVPVVADADCSGVNTLVGHARSGLLVPHSDETALAQALSQLIEDPALRDRFGAAGQADMAQFDIASVAGAWITLFEDLTRGS